MKKVYRLALVAVLAIVGLVHPRWAYALNAGEEFTVGGITYSVVEPPNPPYAGQALVKDGSKYAGADLKLGEVESGSEKYFVQGVGEGAFRGNTHVQTLTVDAKFKFNIGKGAFEGCTALRTIAIAVADPYRCAIYEGAFRGCAALEELELPTSVSALHTQAFAACTSLRKAKLVGVMRLMPSTFAGCTALAEISLGAPLTEVALGIPDAQGVSKGDAFEDCPALRAFNIAPGNAKFASHEGVLYSKGRGTLLRCPPQKEGRFVLPSETTRLSELAFRGCGKIASIELGEKLEAIPPIYREYSGKMVATSAFLGCSGLTEFAVPEGNAHFTAHEGVLYSKGGKELLQYPQGRTSEHGMAAACERIAPFALQHGRVERLTLSAGLQEIGDPSFDACHQLRHIQTPEGSTHFTAVDGILYDKEQRRLIRCPQAVGERVVVPSPLEHIGPKAFAACRELKSLTLPATLQSIGKEAFVDTPALSELSLCARKPIALSLESFDAGRELRTIKLRVPSVSKERYGDNPQWSKFTIADLLPTAVKLDAERAEKFPGEGFDIAISVTPEEAKVQWEVVDKGVAELTQEGRVVTKAPGATEIHVLDMEGKKLATFSLTVVAKPVPNPPAPDPKPTPPAPQPGPTPPVPDPQPTPPAPQPGPTPPAPDPKPTPPASQPEPNPPAPVSVLAAGLSLAPNPAGEVTYLRGVRGEATVELLTIDGRPLARLAVGADGAVSVRGLEPGVYLLRVNGVVLRLVKS